MFTSNVVQIERVSNGAAARKYRALACAAFIRHRSRRENPAPEAATANCWT
jgi:hypothetical protein